MNRGATLRTTLAGVLVILVTAPAEDLAILCADRLAIERVYYNHRTGTKPPFEQVLPANTVEQLVRQDLHKEALLKRVYGVEVTPAQLAAEVQRIDTATRAPGVLIELKAALDGDPHRFARTVAKPTIVERLLRQHFENDDLLHASQRREAERLRHELRAAHRSRGEEALLGDSAPRSPRPDSSPDRIAPPATNELISRLLAILRTGHSNEVSEITWRLGAPPAAAGAVDADRLGAGERFGPNAPILSRPRDSEREQEGYFDDLPSDLRTVVRAQLRQPGDVSAVIETPRSFLLYVMKEETDTTMSVACLTLVKRSYARWLEAQTP